ncbi:hypothetical protein DL766_005165 [Monosporascus sp. MC13-8B]|uniref:Uncharacterized protein n=1 Tax=Monosporascus cannonballus TaxID=155416 RepID=A0ABY0HIL8_9PEZI|nr:hypothetical protein DL763_005693 [Monosporascus cannonballus]RYO94295.1 hypothetical protein DL762_000619 [Monosporascus cannonballus]RYP29866.1 hypothetical protein DL766_005165 [Monosporascus sp. MC13-8B]
MSANDEPRFRGRPAASPPSTSGSAEAGADKADPQDILKRGTRARRVWIVGVGNTGGGSIRDDIYFFKLDLSDIIVKALPPGQLVLTNSIARTLGLHDFYQVGLWSFCEGYEDSGITYCSEPSPMFWFNPVEVLLNELLAGASIALPSQVNDVLTILRIASHIMFGFFLASAALNFILMLAAPIVVYSRIWSGPFSILAFISTILVLVASSLGTAMSFAFKFAMDSQPDLNVNVEVGMKMLGFMWVATGFTLLAFVIHAGLCCCCTSRRDIKTGRRGAWIGARTRGEKGGYNLPNFNRVERTAPPSA